MASLIPHLLAILVIAQVGTSRNLRHLQYRDRGHCERCFYFLDEATNDDVCLQLKWCSSTNDKVCGTEMRCEGVMVNGFGPIHYCLPSPCPSPIIHGGTGLPRNLTHSESMDESSLEEESIEDLQVPSKESLSSNNTDLASLEASMDQLSNKSTSNESTSMKKESIDDGPGYVSREDESREEEEKSAIDDQVEHVKLPTQKSSAVEKETSGKVSQFNATHHESMMEGSGLRESSENQNQVISTSHNTEDFGGSGDGDDSLSEQPIGLTVGRLTQKDHEMSEEDDLSLSIEGEGQGDLSIEERGKMKMSEEEEESTMSSEDDGDNDNDGDESDDKTEDDTDEDSMGQSFSKTNASESTSMNEKSIDEGSGYIEEHEEEGLLDIQRLGTGTANKPLGEQDLLTMYDSMEDESRENEEDSSIGSQVEHLELTAQRSSAFKLEKEPTGKASQSNATSDESIKDSLMEESGIRESPEDQNQVTSQSHNVEEFGGSGDEDDGISEQLIELPVGSPVQMDHEMSAEDDDL